MYQPGAALVKSQLQDRYALQKGLCKLNPNTQLFTSDRHIADFFGRIFFVKENISLNKKELKRVLPEMKANVITKNYPLSPQEIIKKYKLKEGGDNYLIAYTDFENRKLIALAYKVKDKE